MQKNHRISFNQLSTIWPQSLHVPSITLPTGPNQTELLQLCPPAPCAEDKLLRTIPIVNTPFKRPCSIQLSTTSNQAFEIAVNSPIMEQRQLKQCGSASTSVHPEQVSTLRDWERTEGTSCFHAMRSRVEYKLTYAIKKLKPDGCSGHHR